MKIVIPGGSGLIGRLLVRELTRDGHECVVLTRHPRPATAGAREVAWDGRTPGPWTAELEGAGAVINLAGRSVDCRYHERNLAEMMDSRVDSTRAIGAAIAAAKNPPRVWLQMSTATIYAHRFDAANDERGGRIGGAEPGVPALWRRSIDLARAWEAELDAAPTPHTRKVALRSAMVMIPERRGVFHVMVRHVRLGFGRFGDGRQFMSWIHAGDFAAAIRLLLVRDDLHGTVNLCAPHPLSTRDFFAALLAALDRRFALPVPRWAVEIGTFFLRTESELVLKSRRVVPARLLEAGFAFRFPDWPVAAVDLVKTWQHAPRP
jgi:uncharacterized protein (TIGR01777 family)